MVKKILSRAFNVSNTPGVPVTSTLLVPYKAAEVVGIDLFGVAFATGTAPEIVCQVSLRPERVVSNQTFDGLLAMWQDGGVRTTDIGLQRLSITNQFVIPATPVAIGQSVYMILTVVDCSAGVWANVWFRIISQ